MFIVPGDIALTRTFLPLNSLATDWVKLLTAAFAAAYMELKAYPLIAELDEIFTMLEVAWCSSM